MRLPRSALVRQRPATCLLGCELDTSNLQRPPGPASMLTFLHSLPLLRAAFRALYCELADLKAQVCCGSTPEHHGNEIRRSSARPDTRGIPARLSRWETRRHGCPQFPRRRLQKALLPYTSSRRWSGRTSHSVKHCSARPSIEHRAGWKGEPSPPALCGASELTALRRPADHGPHLHPSPPLASAGEGTASTPPTSNF